MRNVKLFEEFHEGLPMRIEDLYTIADTAFYISVDGMAKRTFSTEDSYDEEGPDWIRLHVWVGRPEVIYIDQTMSKATLTSSDTISIRGPKPPDEEEALTNVDVRFYFSPDRRGFSVQDMDGIVERSPAMKAYLTALFERMSKSGELKSLEEAERFFDSSLEWIPASSMPEAWKRVRRSRGAFGRF
jgi:hypothetical protein